MPVVATTAGKIYYAEKDDPLSRHVPLILVHGAGSNHLTWSAEIRRLPGTRVIAPDLPGHGRSPLPGHQSMSAYAESVRQLMAALEIPRAVIVGHSMGGGIALTMGIHMREVVAGLVLVATGAQLKVNPKILNTVLDDPEAVVDMIMRWAWSRDADEDVRRQGRKQLMATSPEVMYGDYLACDNFDIVDHLTEIEVPTLIVGAKNDKMTPLALSETLTAGITQSTFVRIEGAGHMIPLERPQAVADHLSRWLDNEYTNIT